MATFHLQVVTPDRVCFDGMADRVLVRTVNGDTCVLANHSDYAAALGIGEARVVDDKGKERRAAAAGGMISVRENQVRVMATTWEWSDEIDVTRAEKALDVAEQRLKDTQYGDREFTMAEMKMKRAMIRINVGRG